MVIQMSIDIVLKGILYLLSFLMEILKFYSVDVSVFVEYTEILSFYQLYLLSSFHLEV